MNSLNNSLASAGTILRQFGLNFVPRGRVARAVSVLAGSTALAQALGILVSPILTRIYEPADYGILAVYSALLLSVGAATTLKYEMAIPIPRRDAAGINLLAVSLLANVSMSMLGAALMWLAYPWMAARGFVTASAIAWLLPVGMLFTGCYRSLSYWAIRLHAYRDIASTRVRQAISSFAVQIALGLLGGGHTALIVGHAFGQGSGIGTLSVATIGRNRSLLKHVKWKRLWVCAVRFKRFPLLATGSGILNTAGLQATPLLLAIIYGPQVAGWYALAERVTSLPINLISNAIAQVYFGEAARVANNPVQIERSFFRVIRKLSVIAIGPTIAAGVLSSRIFGVVFGDEWRTAGVFVQIMAVLLFTKLIAAPVSQTLLIIQRQDLSVAWSGLRLLVVVAAIGIPFRLGFDAIVAVAASAISGSIMYVGLILVSIYALRKMATKKMQLDRVAYKVGH